MANKKLISRYFAILLLLFILPTFTQNVSASLKLTKPSYPELNETWTHHPFLYDSHYHNTTELWEEIASFEADAPEIIDVEVIGQSFYGKEIKAVRITNEFRTNQKAKAHVVANHHGREQISVEIALQFILYLVTGYGVDSSITEWIDTQEIYIVPTINPDALDKVVTEHDRMLRKNARPYDDDNDGSSDEDPFDDLNMDGIISWYVVYEKSGPDLNYIYHYYEGEDNDMDGLVNEDVVGHIDLNRNYDRFFRDGIGWSDDSLAGNYPGITPFSEPEIQVYRDFVLQHRFAMAYSLHSGTNATYFVRSSHEYLEADIAYAMLSDFAAMMQPEYYFNEHFDFDPYEDPYYAAGVWDYWMYFDRQSLMPMTLELYGNKSADFIMNETEIPIFENSTHLITEWKEINNFYNPEKQYINALWDDVQPAFPYLLENTPRLEVLANLHSYDDLPGSTVNITFLCYNLSPKLRTISDVDVFDSTGVKIFDGEEIPADSVVQIDAIFSLPTDFVDSYEIKIGNEYTGYHHYVLEINTETIRTNYSFSIIGLAIVILWIGRKKIRK